VLEIQFLAGTFYFSHNIDFCGHAYPVPLHLNHISDDLSRGLTTFGEAKPLGEHGLNPLEPNLHGFDRANFDERVQLVGQRMDEVHDSSTKPLEVTSRS
jgi:DNA-directed RNA polymerase